VGHYWIGEIVKWRGGELGEENKQMCSGFVKHSLSLTLKR